MVWQLWKYGYIVTRPTVLLFNQNKRCCENEMLNSESKSLQGILKGGIKYECVILECPQIYLKKLLKLITILVAVFIYNHRSLSHNLYYICCLQVINHVSIPSVKWKYRHGTSWFFVVVLY